MQNFNTIPKQGSFGTAVDLINANFSLAMIAINGVEYSTSRCKGLFLSESALNLAVPTPQVGDWALVKGTGESIFPCPIYICSSSGTWTDSGDTYDSTEIPLEDYLTLAAFNTWKAEIESFLTSLETYRGLKGHLSLQSPNCIHVTDGNGNIVATIDSMGVNSIAFNIKDQNGTTIGVFDNASAAAIANIQNSFRFIGNGLKICDEYGNYSVEVNEQGVFDAKAIGNNLRNIIASIAGGNTMPTYISEEYNNTLLKVQSLQGSDTFSFAFITDLHYCDENSTMPTATKATLRNGVINAMTAMAKLSKEYPLATAVANGDYVQLPSTHTKQMGIDCIMDLNKWMADMHCPNFALCGNHEYSYSGNPLDSSNFGLTRSEIYNYLSRKYVTSEVKKAGERVYYQIDDADGVVFVYITTTGACATLGVSISTSGIENDLKSAYDEVIAANTANYPYILFSHYSNNLPTNGLPATVNNNVGYTIDYFNTSGTVLFYVGGHIHSDWALVHTNGSKNTLVVSCLQAGAWTNEQSQDGTIYSHVAGTDTESAFTVFTVNKLTGQVHCTRFGLGRDRTINYNTTSGAIGVITYSD